MVSGNVNAEGGIAGDGVLADVLRYLRENAARLPGGRHEIRDGMFAIVSEYAPGDAAAKRFETHAKYADVQYVIAGGETILATPAAGLAVTEDLLAERDVRFHAEPPDAAVTAHALAAGEYLLLLPEDAHKPECDAGVPFCRKCVVKIPVGLLAR